MVRSSFLKRIALKVPAIRTLWEERNRLSAENRTLIDTRPGHRLFHYDACFDPQRLIEKYAVSGLSPSPGLLTNFLGIKIPPSLFPSILDGLEGTVEGLPFPGNWHADIAEWGSALLAVDEATDIFRIVELGCGWACWLNNMGAAAKSRGLRVDLIGIEGDKEHVTAAHSILALNRFESTEFRVVHGVAAPQRGKALFPIVENAGSHWGSEPIFYPTDAQMMDARKSNSHEELEAYTLDDLAQNKIVDLLHIDIQGGEASFIADNIRSLNRIVKRVLVGTHSRILEGKIVELLSSEGWIMEMDRPAIVVLGGPQPIVRIDGVQLFRNTIL